jgi:hypothetical protein
MRTLSISITENEYLEFGIKENKLNFSDFVDIVSKRINQQNLLKSTELAEKYGLSSLSLDEIRNEVKAVRANAKSHN